MDYYCVYVNKPRKYICIHKSSCGCCKEKKGEHDLPDTDNSFWDKNNYNSLEAAKSAVKEKNYTIKICMKCNK